MVHGQVFEEDIYLFAGFEALIYAFRVHRLHSSGLHVGRGVAASWNWEHLSQPKFRVLTSSFLSMYRMRILPLPNLNLPQPTICFHIREQELVFMPSAFDSARSFIDIPQLEYV